MQIGQVPVMFAPDPVVNDTRAITTGPQDLTTMFPQDLNAGEMDMADDCILCGSRAWILVGLAAVVIWAWRKPRR